MKKRILQNLSKAFAIIVISSIFVSCNTNNEIGTASTNFTISGTVTDSISNASINNIKLILTKSYFVSNAGMNSTKTDTVASGYTDVLGTYRLQFKTLPPSDMVFKLKTQDIDGIDNGGMYNDREITVPIESYNWDRKASDVNGGRVTITQIIKLMPR